MKYYMTTKKNNNTLWSPWTLFDELWSGREAIAPASMRTDIQEDDKQYTMAIELAGYSKENIKLDFDNGYLTVSATKEEEADDKYVRKESKSSASRSYYIGDYETSDIRASYNNGVLQVVIPKIEEVKKSTAIAIS